MALIIALVVALAATAPAHRPIPRTPDGRPDLQGYWTNLSLTRLERDGITFSGPVATEAEAAAYEAMMNDPARQTAYFDGLRAKAGLAPTIDVGTRESEWFERLTLMRIDGERRTAFITDPKDGRLPYTKAALARHEASEKRIARVFDNPEDRGIWERCLTSNGGGPPLGNTTFNANYAIVQTKDEVAIAIEMNHDVRHIRIGGSRPAGTPPGWLGASIGVWEGDALRVETTGFSAAYADGQGLDVMLSPDAKLTEWFTRTGPQAILYRFQVDDPKTYTRTWRGEMVLRRGEGLQEYACHEGNYALPGILAGAREWERQRRPLQLLDGGDPPPKSAPPASATPVKAAS